MVNEEKLKCMMRLARLDTTQQSRIRKEASYYRNDYMTISMIKRFLQMTVAYALLIAFLAATSLDFIMANVNRFNYRILFAEIIIGYLVFIGIYLAITYIVSSFRYRRARRARKEYEEAVRDLDRFYEREEREEWEEYGDTR